MKTMKTPCQTHDNAEQLAVEWLIKELNNMSLSEFSGNWRIYANKALVKSKQQMQESFIAGGKSAFNMLKSNEPIEQATFQDYLKQNYA